MKSVHRATIRLTPRHRRRGGVYVAVLGLSLMAATLATGALLSVRGQTALASGASDVADAQQYAQSAIELARLWIAQDANWRTNRPHGTWVTNAAIGSGTYSVSVTDPADGNLADDPHQSVVVTATGTKGQAIRTLQVTLRAEPVALPALKYAIHTAGQFHIRASKRLWLGTAAASTNGTLRNDGTIFGKCEAQLALPAGTVTGGLTLLAPAKGMPRSGMAEKYAALGTVIAPGNTIDKQVLTPTSNPYGQPNPLGIYVIRATADTTIKDSRIEGTIVFINSAKKITIDGTASIRPARADLPALIVVGETVIQFNSVPVSEAALATNLNPPGAPYNGIADADLTDVYPSEIRGLIHSTGPVTLSHDGVLRGAIISESAALSDAVDLGDDREIFYDPALFTSPPRWYTSSVPMKVVPGSWRTVTSP